MAEQSPRGLCSGHPLEHRGAGDRWAQRLIALLILWGGAALATPTLADEQADAATAREERLRADVTFLSADEREGRGIGTAGIDAAAEHLAGEFRKLGLLTEQFAGTPFQTFTMTVGAELGATNQAALVRPRTASGDPELRIVLELGADFNPLALGGSGEVDLPLALAGYGITAKEKGYDDYADFDATGKALVILRHAPQPGNPHALIDGQDASHAPFQRKLSNAYEHGAAAVIFCTDQHEIIAQARRRGKQLREALGELATLGQDFEKLAAPSLDDLRTFEGKVAELTTRAQAQTTELRSAYDPLIGFRGAGTGSDAPRIPVLFCRRGVIDALLRAESAPLLANFEQAIDEGPKPRSRDLAGWRLQAKVEINRQQAEVKNVVAVLPGEGPHSEETIVIGAHYDHLGFGGEGSFEPGEHVVHNGADDNGSGAAALLEIARLLADRPQRLPRRVVFIAFTAEERGLIGSARYCREPLVPMAQTVAMLNLDMVGRLSEEKLTIQGLDTAKEFDSLVEQLNTRFGFQLTKQAGGFGPSDHSSFFGQKVPVMHFFTGLHPDYHRPSDDLEKLNLSGMRRIAELVAEVAVAVAEAPERPTFVESAVAVAMREGGSRPYFGSVPDFSQDQEGYAITGVSKGSPAEKAGLAGGDVIIRFGDSKVGNLEDFDSALRKYKAGDKVPVVVRRGGQEVPLEVELAEPR